jgi:beta-fructofuranosidase
MPGEGDEGIFSGGAFVDRDGVATIAYWRLGKPDGVAIATSTDPELERWTKCPQNPVLASTQLGLAQRAAADGRMVTFGTADPSAPWEHNGRYYLLTGNLLVLEELGNRQNRPEHRGDTAYLFVSDDLVNWTYLHPFYQSRREWTRETEDCMCPDFFPLPLSPEGGPPSSKHMLLFISHNLGCQYYLGSYARDRFTPEQHGRMTWVDNEFFAPESLRDDRGRRIMWSWIFDRRSQASKDASGWSGELSLPRVLWEGEDGTLRMRPADELAGLRYNPQTRTGLAIAADSTIPLPEMGGASLELEVQMRSASALRYGVKVFCSPDAAEETLVAYDTVAGALTVDTRKASLGEGTKTVESAPFRLRADEPLELRIFLDKSVVEVFANDRQAIARRVYPTRPDSTQAHLFAQGGAATALRVRKWEMMPSNPY